MLVDASKIDPAALAAPSNAAGEMWGRCWIAGRQGGREARRGGQNKVKQGGSKAAAEVRLVVHGALLSPLNAAL